MYLHNYDVAVSDMVLVSHGTYSLFGRIFVDDGFGNLIKTKIEPVCTFILGGAKQ